VWVQLVVWAGCTSDTPASETALPKPLDEQNGPITNASASAKTSVCVSECEWGLTH